MKCKFECKNDLGLLVLRLGFGGVMMAHGIPKLMGGVETWNRLGSSMGNFGINFGFTFFGFMASFAEAVGGLMIILGLFQCIATILIGVTMLVATVKHSVDAGIMKALHPLLIMLVSVAMHILGPGKKSLMAKCFPDAVKK